MGGSTHQHGWNDDYDDNDDDNNDNDEEYEDSAKWRSSGKVVWYYW